jgi:hypothetical protein
MIVQRGLVRQAFQPDPASPLSLKPGKQVRLESLTYKRVLCPTRLATSVVMVIRGTGRFPPVCRMDGHRDSHGRGH